MDVKDIHIKVVNDTLILTSGNMITGEIYFIIDDNFFPSKGWNDFVVVILTWWHETILNLIQNEQKGLVEEFSFMDGPLKVNATKISEDVLKLNFIRDRKETEESVFEIKTSIIQFKNALLKTTDELLLELKRKNWNTDDTRELEKKFTLLQTKLH